ncbi:MAG TPA: hypothetical protein VGE79_05550 [Niastella sp.]
MNIIGRLLLLFLSIVVVIAGLYIWGLFTFSGTFDNKYNSDALTKEFIAHEKEFSDLATFFITNLPKNKKQTVYFGLGSGNRVNLNIYPSVFNPATKVIGGPDLKIGSPELDSALAALGWTDYTAKMLRHKLSKTNCDWITVVEQPRTVIKVYPNPEGLESFAYYILDRPVNDTLAKIYDGWRISNSGFGKRVILKYTPAYVGMW